MKTIRYILTLVLVLVAMAWAASDQNTFKDGIVTPFITELHSKSGVSFDDKKITNILSISEDLSIFDATTSAQLLGVISDETGSGLAVFGTSPTLVTPVLGVATGTSFQGVVGNVTPAAGTFTTLTSTALIAPEGTPVNAVASEGKLTSSGALVPATHATSEIVSDATNVADGETVTINATVYRFKDTPAQAYDINVGVSAAESLDFLKLAINATGTGDGSDYYTGTLVHPDVVATTNTDTVQTILARVPGDEMNAYATTETSAHLAWADTTLGGGTGNSNPGVTSAAATLTINSRAYMFVDALSEDEADAIVDQILYGGSEAVALDNLKVALNAGATEGTEYSTGTVVNPDVTATTNTNTTQVIQAKVKGVAGDLITTTETLANTVWDDVTLGTETAGVDGTIAVANELKADATYLYHAVLANTIADANWRRIALGAAY